MANKIHLEKLIILSLILFQKTFCLNEIPQINIKKCFGLECNNNQEENSNLNNCLKTCQRYRPINICAKDGKTYPNICSLNCHVQKIAYVGECKTFIKTRKRKNCKRKCDNIPKNPVCGKDKNTYKNACRAICKNIEIDYKGKCKTFNDPPGPRFKQGPQQRYKNRSEQRYKQNPEKRYKNRSEQRYKQNPEKRYKNRSEQRFCSNMNQFVELMERLMEIVVWQA